MKERDGYNESRSRMRSGRCGRHRKRKRSTKTTHVCHSNEEKYVQLKKWICSFDKRCKIDLVPCDFLETGRGLQSKDGINRGEIIVSIPECTLITSAVVLDTEIGRILKRCVPPLSPQRILSVFLAYEVEKGKTSSWYPYLQTLPVKFTTPLYFSNKELKCLPAHIYSRACKEHTRVEGVFSDIYTFLSAHMPKLDFFTYEKFRWAWCVVNTRSVYVKTEESPFLSLLDREADVALAPYLDLLNHSSYAKTEARLNHESGCFEIVTYDCYEKYSQVFIHYNPYSNENLFMEYGFTLPGNPYNVFEFTTDDISLLKQEFSISNWERKISILKENDLDKGLMCTVDGLSWKLQTLLRVAAMSWDELKTWKSVYHGEVSRDNELKAVNMAEHLIKWALQKNREYLVEKTDSLSDHERLALSLAQDNQDLLEQSRSFLKKLHL